MVDIIDLAGDTGALTSGVQSASLNFGSGLFMILLIAVSASIIAFLLWFVLWRSSFKNIVKIKEIISSDGHFLVLQDMAKRKIIAGAEFWKLRRRKCIVPAPPSGALQVTARGRYFAECAHHEKSGLDSGYQWIIPDKEPTSGAYAISQSQEERALVADRLRRANDRKSMRTIDFIMQISGMIFAVIIVVSLLAFYGEIAQSVAEASKEVEGALQRAQNIQEAQNDFQKQLNDIFKTMSCEPPENPVNLPLDEALK